MWIYNYIKKTAVYWPPSPELPRTFKKHSGYEQTKDHWIWFTGVRRYLLPISRQVACRSVRKCGNNCSDCKVLTANKTTNFNRHPPGGSSNSHRSAAIQIVLHPADQSASFLHRLAVSTTADHFFSLGFSYRASFKYYDKGCQQMPLSFVIFLYLHVSSLHVSGFYQPIIRGILSCCLFVTTWFM